MKSKFFTEVKDNPPKLKKCSARGQNNCINPNVNSSGYLPIEEFAGKSEASDGLDHSCRQCSRRYDAQRKVKLTEQWHKLFRELGYGECLICGITDMDVMNYHHYNPTNEEFREKRDMKRRGESMNMEGSIMHSILKIRMYSYTDKNIAVLKKALSHTHSLCTNHHVKFHSVSQRVLAEELVKNSKLSLYKTQEFETYYYPIWLKKMGVDPNHPMLKDWDWNENFQDHKQLEIDEDIFVEESVETIHHIENFI